MLVMTAAGLTAILLFSSTVAAVSAAELSQCSDKNKLNGVSVDARLTAIEFYFQGIIDGQADGGSKSCFAARVLDDGKLAFVNKTLELIEHDCLPIAQAVRLAAEGQCP